MSGAPPSPADLADLAQATALASRGPAGDPNPRVGALIRAASGALVGSGWHRGAGTPHAEVVALAEAGVRAAGGTAYVTLEPCVHRGRTGPCVEALIDAGVRTVVYAESDPNPAAAGGAEQLRSAGVDVRQVRLPAAADLNQRWSTAVRRGRPYVTWKVGATLDGRVAAADGSSRWITGPEARRDVHELRAAVGAIVVGTGTVLADNPALTVRDEQGQPVSQQPVPVVVGEREVPADAAVRAAPDLVQVTSRDPHAALTTLWDKQIRHVLLESGPTVAAAWLRAGVVDEIRCYLAPSLLGAGPSLVGDLGIGTLADVLRLELQDVTRLGDDVRLILRPVTHPQGS